MGVKSRAKRLAGAPRPPRPEPVQPAPPPPTGIQLAPYQVVLRPLVTEKGVHRSNMRQYAFEVHPLANKETVREAVQELFKVTVLKVRTQNRKGKSRRYRYHQGQTKDWKKAIVTLGEDQRIDFF